MMKHHLCCDSRDNDDCDSQSTNSTMQNLATSGGHLFPQPQKHQTHIQYMQRKRSMRNQDYKAKQNSSLDVIARTKHTDRLFGQCNPLRCRVSEPRKQCSESLLGTLLSKTFASFRQSPPRPSALCMQREPAVTLPFCWFRERGRVEQAAK